MSLNLAVKTREILENLLADSHLAHFVCKLPIPKVYSGNGRIKLVILGQDPTVKNKASRATITTVLNLDKSGSLKNYLSRICTGLGISLENVYATNYLKNFFTEPPTQIKEIDIFKEFTPYWLPLLKEELAQFPHVPIIVLGQPLLLPIVCGGASSLVRDYWAYTANWKSGEKGIYRYVEPDKNILGRVVFPFPHQPSIGKQFYTKRFEEYIAFIIRKHLIT